MTTKECSSCKTLVEKGPTVTLDYNTIIDITNTMNDNFPKGERPSQGYLEWSFLDAVRKHTSTDFFEYLKELDEAKPDSLSPES